MSKARWESWTNYGVFTSRWWVLLGILIIPWFIWYLLIDKRRLQEMFLYIFATSFIAVLLDEIGGSFSLWSYPINVVPFFPRLITANYTLVPIIFSLVYQYASKWKLFIIVNIILTIIFSYILEPILVWGKLYTLINWKHSYSIPVYFFAALILKWFLETVKKVQNKS